MENKKETNEQKLSEIKEEGKKQRQLVTIKQREITRLQKKLEQVTARNAELEITAKTVKEEYERNVQSFKDQLENLTEQIQEKEIK